jgi:hypothetical protein
MFLPNKTTESATSFQLNFFELEESRLDKSAKCRTKLNFNLCQDSKFTHQEQTATIVDDCACR